MGELDSKSAAAKKNLQNIKRIIGVYSGKGGVGKTTMAINIAATLAKKGYRTCLLDADIDCPNVAHALGVEGELDIEILNERIIPLERHGMKIISMASVQNEGAIVWRGPMVTDMLMQFLAKTNWGTADYLIIDLPPGTSDIPLTIMKFVQPHGIVLVTTPRSIAEADAKKSANLAQMTNIPVLGVIENMSGPPFGTGTGLKCAHELKTLYLGPVKFHDNLLHSVDNGYPAITKHEEQAAELDYIISRIQEAEQHLLGDKIPKPNKLLANAKNLALDFKEEFIDRYKEIKR